MIELAVIIALSALSAGLGFALYESRQELNIAHEEMQAAQRAAERADERVTLTENIYSNFIGRTSQIVIPPEACERMAHLIAEHLSAAGLDEIVKPRVN